MAQFTVDELRKKYIEIVNRILHDDLSTYEIIREIHREWQGDKISDELFAYLVDFAIHF